MQLIIDGDGFKLIIRWRSLIALARVLGPLITAVAALLALPQVVQLGHMLGWW